jgi:hypothetical protein
LISCVPSFTASASRQFTELNQMLGYFFCMASQLSAHAETRCNAHHRLVRVPLLEPAAISCPQIGSAACAAIVEHGEHDRACYAKEPTSTLCAHVPEDGLIPMCADVGGSREALLVQRAAVISLLTEEEWRRMAGRDATPAIRRLNVVALSWLLPIKPPAEGLPMHLAPSADNLGNLVWRYATQRLVDESSTVLISSKAEISWIEGGGRPRATALIHPEANLLMPQQFANSGILAHTRTVLAWVRRLDLPTTLVGIGFQIPFDQNALTGIEHSRNELQLSAVKPESIATRHVRLHDDQLALMWAVGNRSRGVLNTVVRGLTTQRVLAQNGVLGTVPIGCPSLMLNPDTACGKTIGAGWQRLMQQPLERTTARLALLLPNRWSDAICEMLFSIFQQYPHSFFVLQQAGDRQIITRAQQKYRLPRVDPARVRYYYDLEVWRRALQGVDLVVGARIHGAMMGLFAGVPSAVIATDHRILELCHVMHVPHVISVKRWLRPASSSWGEALPLPSRAIQSFDVRGFVAHVAPQFDSAAFDRNRAATASAYVRILESLGVAPNPLLSRIASVARR